MSQEEKIDKDVVEEIKEVEDEVDKELNLEDIKLSEEVIYINRVAKVVKGGRRFSFSALVVVGDHNRHVGTGFGKANEVPEAIRKAVEDAKKNIIEVPLIKRTIPHEVIGIYGAGRVLIKPATEGTGLIAGSGVRAVLEMAGIQDALTKCLGSRTKINLVAATMDALKKLRKPEYIASLREKTVPELFK